MGGGGGVHRGTHVIPAAPSHRPAPPTCAFVLFCLVAKMGTVTSSYRRSKDGPQRSPRQGLLVHAALWTQLGVSNRKFWHSGHSHRSTSALGEVGVRISLKRQDKADVAHPPWTESGSCQSGSELGRGSLGTCAQLRRGPQTSAPRSPRPPTPFTSDLRQPPHKLPVQPFGHTLASSKTPRAPNHT